MILLALALVLAAPVGHVDRVWHVGDDVVWAWSVGDRHDLNVRHGATAQTLVRASPFPFRETSVRSADLTRDGQAELLVTVECDECNHAAATASVFARTGAMYRRVYGW